MRRDALLYDISHTPSRISRASSLVRVILSSFHEEGRRDSLCFTRMWEARTWETDKMDRRVQVDRQLIVQAFYLS